MFRFVLDILLHILQTQFMKTSLNMQAAIRSSSSVTEALIIYRLRHFQEHNTWML